VTELENVQVEPVDPPVEEKQEAAVEAPEIEVEVVDDTPEKDRRPPRRGEAKVEDPEDDALGEKAKRRINRLKYDFHEERRQKEEKERQLAQAVQYASSVRERLMELERRAAQGDRAVAENAKARLDSELDVAKRNLKEAYEAGDATKIADTNAELARLASRRENVVIPPEAKEEPHREAPQPPQQHSVIPAEKQAEYAENLRKWVADNSSWFNRDEEMTTFAKNVHTAVVENGVIPSSPAYFRIIDARMKEVFADRFGDAEESTPAPAAPVQQRKSTSVVAPSTRSNGSTRKLVIPKSAAETARRLGVPLEEYAKYYYEANPNG
jgi:hypothetical protein